MSMRTMLRADETVSSLRSSTSSSISVANTRNAAMWWMNAAVTVAVIVRYFAVVVVSVARSIGAVHLLHPPRSFAP
jgi:hypothetical protein